MVAMNLVLLAAAGEGAEPRLMGLDAEGWVYAAITIFFLVAVFYAGAHRRLTSALDAMIAETRRSLDEAAAIRAEAEALLAGARRQQAESHGEAATILAHAEQEAAAIVAKAQADTTGVIASRARMATDKIEAAERAAIAGLRDQAASAATQAAGALIAARHDAGADKALVDAAIAAI